MLVAVRLTVRSGLAPTCVAAVAEHESQAPTLGRTVFNGVEIRRRIRQFRLCVCDALATKVGHVGNLILEHLSDGPWIEDGGTCCR